MLRALLQSISSIAIELTSGSVTMLQLPFLSPWSGLTMPLMQSNFSKNLLLLLFYILIGLMLIAPISSNTYLPALADYGNHFAAIVQAKIALNEGQFPLRIAPLEGNGMRYAFFQFYAPTTYMIGGLIHKWLLPHNIQYIIQFFLISGIVIGGIYINKLAYWLTKSRPSAIIASIVFLTSPYFIIIINRMSAMNEVIALGLTPAAIYYTLLQYSGPSTFRFNALKMMMVWYLLATIHTVTFIYTSFFTAILLVMMTCKYPKHFKQLFFVGATYSVSLLLAMWYLAPIALLGKYLEVGSSVISTDQFILYRHTLSQLLSMSALGSLELVKVHPSIGLPIIAAICICLYAAVSNKYIKHLRGNMWFIPLLILFFLSMLMVWSPFNFWKWLPHEFQAGQYTWRYMGQLVWIGSLLFGWAFCWIFNTKMNHQHTILGILFVILATSMWYPANIESNNTPRWLFKHPNFVFNTTSYEMDYNRHESMVDKIDDIVLYTLMVNNILQFNTKYVLTKSLINFIADPALEIQGDNKNHRPIEIIIRINNKNISTKTIQPGKFNFIIPIAMNVIKLENNENVTIEIKPGKKTSAKDTINMGGITLGHFINPTTTINANETKKYCELKKQVTVCKIDVPKNITTLELPILFYKNLLDIKLNGKSVPYFSVVYHAKLLVGIRPIAGQVNHIEIRFTGLMWANYISRIAWALLLLFCIKLIVDQYKIRRIKKNPS